MKYTCLRSIEECNYPMKYHINNELIYDSNSRMLWHIASPDEHILISETAGRLLVRLLETPNTVIDRETMIYDVWDKFGYIGTGSSLTQYISILRKIFSSMNEGDIIRTIPKLGFSFNANIIKDVAPPIAHDFVELSDNKNTKQSLDSSGIESRRVRLKKISPQIILYIWLPFFLAILFLVRITTSLYFHPPLFTNVNLFKLGDIKDCSVYTLSTYSVEYQEQKLKIANQFSSFNLPCINNSFFIFDPEDLYIFESKGRVFLTRCTYKKDSTNEISGCKDVYIHN